MNLDDKMLNIDEKTIKKNKKTDRKPFFIEIKKIKKHVFFTTLARSLTCNTVAAQPVCLKPGFSTKIITLSNKNKFLVSYLRMLELLRGVIVIKCFYWYKNVFIP